MLRPFYGTVEKRIATFCDYAVRRLEHAGISPSLATHNAQKANAMFRDPRDEEKICQVLKAYVEEFGPEHVVVALPKAWNNPGYSLGPTRLEFSTDGTIDVRVDYGPVQLSYQVQLVA